MLVTNLRITFISSSNEYSELGAVVEWEHGACRRCVSGDPAALGGTDSCSLIIVIMQHAAVYLCGYDKPPKNNIDIQYKRFFLPDV